MPGSSSDLTKKIAQAQAKQAGKVGTEFIAERLISQEAQTSPAFQAGYLVSSLIRIGAALGSMFYNLAKTKEKAKKREKIREAQEGTKSYLEALLAIIQQEGLALVESDLPPTSPEFEKLLASRIYGKTGYRGNCDADIWAPKTESQPVKTRSKLMKIRSGTVLEVSPGVVLPSNVGTLWAVHCSNIKDGWIVAYQNKLLREGRALELQAFQETLKKTQWYLRAVFGVLGLALTVIFIKNLIRRKS